MAEELVARVKQIQRTDPSGKAAWWNYADKLGQMQRDPAKHQAESLQSFLNQYDQGAFVGAVSVSSDSSPLVSLFKEGQRNSPYFKTAWAAYNQMNGNLMCDPAKASKETLVAFLEFLGQLGVNALGKGMMGKGMMGKGMMGKGMMGKDMMNMMGNGMMGKAMMGKGMMSKGGDSWGGEDSSWSGKGGGGPMKKAKFSSGDASFDALVEKVKQFQRSGDKQKEAWWSFCDAVDGKNRDPARHEAHVLETFLSDYGFMAEDGYV